MINLKFAFGVRHYSLSFYYEYHGALEDPIACIRSSGFVQYTYQGTHNSIPVVLRVFSVKLVLGSTNIRDVPFVVIVCIYLIRCLRYQFNSDPIVFSSAQAWLLLRVGLSNSHQCKITHCLDSKLHRRTTPQAEKDNESCFFYCPPEANG